MNTSKLTNGSEAEVLDKTSETPPKSARRSAARVVAKKVREASYWTKDQDKTSTGESRKKLHFGETCLPLLRQRRLGSQLHQAAGSPLSQMFQQALWIGGNDQEGESQEGQEVDLLQIESRGRAVRRSSASEHL